MKQSTLSLVVITIVSAVCLCTLPVSGYGRLWEPPGRSTMWRKGYDTPKEYDDHQLFCGGFHHQVLQGYKCGVCGDPYDGPKPHEAGGKFATGTIAATYTQGQEVTLVVDLTANHRGFFEFKICPTNSSSTKATHACLDRYPLQLADNSGTKYHLNFLGSRLVKVAVKLPSDLTCDFCVLQWRYHAGNSWGTGSDGKSCVGCGNQEEFYGCADVKINGRK